jgi:hypothetical protein
MTRHVSTAIDDPSPSSPDRWHEVKLERFSAVRLALLEAYDRHAETASSPRVGRRDQKEPELWRSMNAGNGLTPQSQPERSGGGADSGSMKRSHRSSDELKSRFFEYDARVAPGTQSSDCTTPTGDRETGNRVGRAGFIRKADPLSDRERLPTSPEAGRVMIPGRFQVDPRRCATC